MDTSRISQRAPIGIDCRMLKIGTYTVQEIGVDAGTYSGIEITRFIAQNDSNEPESCQTFLRFRPSKEV